MKMLHTFNLALMVFMIGSSAVLAHKRCKITDQSGSGEGMWCSNHDKSGMIRCYAEVEYSDGTQAKIWGDDCYDSYADCWASGRGGVEPKCSK